MAADEPDLWDKLREAHVAECAGLRRQLEDVRARRAEWRRQCEARRLALRRSLERTEAEVAELRRRCRAGQAQEEGLRRAVGVDVARVAGAVPAAGDGGARSVAPLAPTAPASASECSPSSWFAEEEPSPLRVSRGAEPAAPAATVPAADVCSDWDETMLSLPPPPQAPRRAAQRATLPAPR
eukprot:EG_transcript_33788